MSESPVSTVFTPSMGLVEIAGVIVRCGTIIRLGPHRRARSIELARP